MAVYKRSYRAYDGSMTPRWSRFLILTRYAARGVFKSRIITGLFVICFFCPIVMAALMYLNHNVQVLSMMKVGSDHLLDINGVFFMTYMGIQGGLAFLLTAFIGPGMVAPDLSNNALPLYFCRPLNRTEYVLGRACVTLFILSFITWIPGLILFGIEASLSGGSWAWTNINYAGGILFGSLIWIVLLTLLALALSAWVKWKLVAGALMLGVMFATSGFAAAINEILRTKVGFYLNPSVAWATICANFFDLPIRTGITTGGCITSLAVMSAFCVWLLSRKIRAFEVVR